MIDPEARLRAALDVMTRDVQPSDELDARVASVVGGAHRHSRWLLPVLAAAVALIVGLVAVLARRDPPPPVVDVGPVPTVPSITGWERSARSPLSIRDRVSVVWTGTRAVVWGGVRADEPQGDGGAVPLADGATYDPATRRWRTIAEAPLEARSEHVAVWTGREMIVWGGTLDRWGAGAEAGSRGPREASDGAAYDPSRNTWRRLSPSPLPPLHSHFLTGVWTGRELIVVGFFEKAAAAYDPVTDSWRTLPAPSGDWFSSRGQRPSLFAGAGGVVAFGRMEGKPASTDSTVALPDTATVEGSLLRPGASAWEPLSPSNLSPARNLSPAWTGSDLIVPGLERPPSTPGSVALLGSARYSLDDGAWRPMAPIPLGYGANVHAMAWTGREVVAIASDGVSADQSPIIRALAYDPATDEWRNFPAPVAELEGANVPLVQAGDRLLLWDRTRFLVSR